MIEKKGAGLGKKENGEKAGISGERIDALLQFGYRGAGEKTREKALGVARSTRKPYRT